MQLLPVTKLSVFPFASIRLFPNEDQRFYNRRVKACLLELEAAAYKLYPKYDIEQEMGIYDVRFNPSTGDVAILFLVRVQDLITILDDGLDNSPRVG